MKSNIAIAIATVVFLSGVVLMPAAAEESAASNLKACFVNLPEVLQNYPEFTKANEALEEFAKPKQKMLSEKAREVEKMSADLKKNLLRSEEAKKEKEDEFKKELGRLQELEKQLQGDLAEKEEEVMNPVRETITKTIETVARARGFNVVYNMVAPNTRQILYMDDSLDITDAVVEKIKTMPEKKEPAAKEKK